jgi:selenocysteine lyase/cysteine desulfurase
MAGLRRLDGVTLWTHPDPERSAAVVSLRPAGLDRQRLAAALYREDGVVGATLGDAERPVLRFSPHLYNSMAEVERTVAAVGRFLERGV